LTLPSPRHLLNILHASNATWVLSGFGAQTKIWLRLLKRTGHGVVNFAYYGLQGAPITDPDGIVNLPQIREQFGNDIIQAYYSMAGGYFPNKKPVDLVWSLYDIFAMDANKWGVLPWAAQTPVDCEPILQHERVQLAACRWPIAMSRHGEAQMKAIGLRPLYVPHGIHTDVFAPMDRTLARQELVKARFLPQPISDDTFLVIVVAANGIGQRKGFSSMFEAFQLFERERPGALMYVHSEPSGVHGQPLDGMVEQLDLVGKVFFPPTISMVAGLVPDSLLRAVYAAGDVKLMLSLGEGFGVTDVEAQSCGTPIVATNFSASIELNFTGWKVNGMMFQHEPMSYQMRPDPADAAAKLVEAYDLWKAGGMPELRERTRQAALAYDVENVLNDYYIPVLDQIGDELEAEPQEAWLRRREIAKASMSAGQDQKTLNWNGLTVPKGPRKLSRRERKEQR